jgi:hypothetical protein
LEPLDLYCERLAPGLAGEPLNALSNLGFFIAAWAVWRFARAGRSLNVGAWVLIALIGAIGLGSTLFHTFANSATHLLDTTPILVFQLAFLWLYARDALRWPRPAAFALVLVFLAAGLYVRRYPEIWNGSFTYIPAWVTLLALGAVHWHRRLAGRYDLLGASALLALSLFFRTIDLAACAALPVGTHFLWHLLNAGVLYLCARALLRNGPPARAWG